MTNSGGRTSGFWSLKHLRMMFQEEKRNTWIHWERALSVVGTLGTVLALFLIWLQTTQTSEQIDAMWYSLQPRVSVNPIKGSDVVSGPFPDSPLPDSLKAMDIKRCRFTSVSSGNSTAVMDSQVVVVLTHKYKISYEYYLGQCLWTPGKSTVDLIDLPLAEGDSAFFDIRLSFKWDMPTKRNEVFSYRQPYFLYWRSNSWHVGTITPDQFDKLCAAFPRSEVVRVNN
jgi:hypothetical protein